jgi:hypothetical protein
MFLCHSNSKSKRHLRWLVFLLLNVLPVRLRRLDPRRFDVIFDLKPESAGKKKGPATLQILQFLWRG